VSKANPTRPPATRADVEQRLAELLPVQQKRLKEYGYNVSELRRIADIEEQADAVDALLAIVTDRKGYVHDSRDVAKAEKVAKTLGAAVSPEGHLIRRKKLEPFYGGRYSMPKGGAGAKKTVWSGPLGGIAICLGVIVVIAVLFVLFK
jgi:hypothetical protein